MINGANEPLKELKHPAEVHTKNYIERLYLALSQMKRYDELFGKKLLVSHNAIIQSITNIIDFNIKDKNHKIMAQELLESFLTSTSCIINDFHIKPPCL